MWLLLPILIPYYMVMWPFLLIEESVNNLLDRLGEHIDLDRLFGF